MLPSISVYYFHAFYFKRLNSFTLKLLSADEHISGAGSKRISFITEGLPWKITVNNWSSLHRKKQPLYSLKKNRNGVPVRSRPTRTLLTNCLAECAHLTITVSQIERDIGRKSSFFIPPLHSTPRGSSRRNITTPFGTEKLE